MKVSIQSGILSQIRKYYSCEPNKLLKIVGLSEKTLRVLDRGGLHKVETVFQLESALWKLWSDSGDGIWTTNGDKDVAPPGLYSAGDELLPITETKIIDGKRCFAILLPSSGFIKLIEDRAQRFKSRFDPETVGDSPDHLRDQRLLAYENYLWNKSRTQEMRLQVRQDDSATPNNIPQARFNDESEEYRFTIQDSLLPLTKAQTKCVQLLDKAINELVSAARETKDTYSKSLLDQMKSEGIEPQRKALMALVAKLKRLNINVLAYSRSKKVRVMDGTWGVGDNEDYGLESNEYLFTLYSGLTHIVLAPSNILRIPFSIPEYEIEWMPETMWSCKIKIVGDEHVHTDVVKGLGTDAMRDEEISMPKKSKVLQLVPKKNRNDDETN